MKKRLLSYLFFSIAIALVIHLINFLMNGFKLTYLLQWEPILVNYVYTAIIGLANILFFGVLSRFFTWQQNPKKMLFLGIIGSVLVSTFSFFIARLLHKMGIDGYTWQQFIDIEHIGNYVFSMLIAFIITLVFHVFYFYKALQESSLREQKIISNENSARLKALQDQLDPHFLFNSLNVLTSLIEENPENAQDFTTGLSKVYRYVLDQKEKDRVPLNEELQFAKSYINLLKMRFEDSIYFHIDASTKSDDYLVPLSLQLVLENAIKHNVISSSKPLSISIYVANDMLVVENSFQPKKQLTQRKGVGLQNIKERYQPFTDKKIKIIQTEKQFKIYLPLLKSN